jgi:excisionase family DNA binding protein
MLEHIISSKNSDLWLPMCGRHSSFPALSSLTVARRLAMPLDGLEIRVSLQKLLLGLVVVIVPLSLVGLHITSESVSSVEEETGAHLNAVAQATAGTVTQFIDHLVTEVGSIALAPALHDAVSAADRSYQNTSAAAIYERMDALETKWAAPAADPLIKEILTSPAAGYLRAYREVDPRLLRIWVTDEAGAIVAATDKPQHNYQGKQGYWQAVYAEGRGRNSVSSVLYDERNRSNYICFRTTGGTRVTAMASAIQFEKLRGASQFTSSSQLLTIEEVAELLHLPVSWVYAKTRRRSKDRIPGFRLGKYWRFREADVLAWIEGQRVGVNPNC